MYFMLCFPEHFLHVWSVQIRLVDEVLEIYGLEVDSLEERKFMINFGSRNEQQLLQINHH